MSNPTETDLNQRKYFEIGPGKDSIILLIPYEHINHFRKSVNVSLAEKDAKFKTPRNKGRYFTHTGTFKDQHS
ncbi:hypothetical protein KA005_50040 [bacterium]|nr:hypothetical protein [bacterium]